ncbi:hypothetical protein AURDEDRAFT_88438 [Auricularia subglabra TFB-10046 SS5]|nr:hypothetical protein AURDEDRAFT_88438 [Auricularia subglabra TFB-10046 SS5]
MTAEMTRRLNSSNWEFICTPFSIGDRLAVVVFFDQQSKLRLTAQLGILLTVECINLLSVRDCPYETGGKMGVAQRAVQTGDVLLREFPLVCMPNCYPNPTDPALAGRVRSMESLLETIIGAHPPEGQLAYRTLSNAWSGYTGSDHRGQGVLTGIYNTNSYPLVGLPSDNIIEYSGVFPTLSRLNHSCRPNANPQWNSETLTIELRALRPIRAGEEVTITYSPDLLIPAYQRRASLREAYHFTCTCTACSDAAVSDARRAEIRGAPRALRNDLMHWAGNQHLVGTDAKYGDEYLLERHKRVCELYEREQLVEEPPGYTHMELVASCYLALGRAREAAFWAKRLHARNRAVFEDDSGPIALALRDVTASPMWNMRQKVAEVMKSGAF